MLGDFEVSKMWRKHLITEKIEQTFYLYKMFYVLCKLLKSDANFIGEKNWKESPGKSRIYTCCQQNTWPLFRECYRMSKKKKENGFEFKIIQNENIFN